MATEGYLLPYPIGALRHFPLKGKLCRLPFQGSCRCMATEGYLPLPYDKGSPSRGAVAVWRLKGSASLPYRTLRATSHIRGSLCGRSSERSSTGHAFWRPFHPPRADFVRRGPQSGSCRLWRLKGIWSRHRSGRPKDAPTAEKRLWRVGACLDRLNGEHVRRVGAYPIGASRHFP